MDDDDLCAMLSDMSDDEHSDMDECETVSVPPPPRDPVQIVEDNYRGMDENDTPESPNKRARHWCFTLHQPTPSTEEAWTLRARDPTITGLRYAIIGDEVCPTTSRRHWQGYLSFRDGKTWSAVRTYIGLGTNGNAWCRIARGTPAQNKAYCSKERVVHEIGSCPRNQQGKRSDLEILTTELVTTGSLGLKRLRDESEFKLLASYVRYRQHLHNAAEDFRESRESEPEVIWCLGPTGAGKSHWIHTTYPNAWWCPPKGPSGLWYDFYDGHEVAVFDDFRQEHMNFSMILRVCDKFPMHVPVKGGTRKFIASTIIFTCPEHPKDVYAGSAENIWQLLRRITKLMTFEAFTDGRIGGEIKDIINLKEEFISARSAGRMPECTTRQNNLTIRN